MGNTYLARLPTRQEMCFVVTEAEVDHEECMDCVAYIRAVDEYIEKGAIPKSSWRRLSNSLPKRALTDSKR